MKTSCKRSIIRAKISTMPRNKSESSSQLEIYKMVTEKQRVQKDLISTKERMVILQQRLDVLNKQIEESEKAINELRQPDPKLSATLLHSSTFIKSNNYQTFELKY